jgi:hypothetical protein
MITDYLTFKHLQKQYRMKKTIIASIALLTVAAVSCKKSSSTTNPTSTKGFTWQENGGATITADSAYLIMGTGVNPGAYLTAYKLGVTPKKMLEVNLVNTSVTSFSIPTQGDFIYWNDTVFYAGSGGSVVVTSNTGGKASGTFDVTFPGGPYSSIKGSFKDIAVK